MNFSYIEDLIGNTPLIRLRHLPVNDVPVLVKMESLNPAGSVKDRPAFNMLQAAAFRGDIAPGDTLVEATSGNTGIALAMAAAILGYRMILVMPENASRERVQMMKVYGADVHLTPAADGMEGAIDYAVTLEKSGKGKIVNQFGNPDNPDAHYKTTGPELWKQTGGAITHFVSSMGTTGTVMGTGRYLKEKNSAIQIVGVHPADGAQIPGIRKWPKEYEPAVYDESALDVIVSVDQQTAEETARQLALKEGILAGISAGGNVAAAIQLASTLRSGVVVTVICDRGERYLSTPAFDL